MNVRDLLEEHVEPALLSLGFMRGLTDDASDCLRWVSDNLQIAISFDPRGELFVDIADARGGASVPLQMLLKDDDPDWHWAQSLSLGDCQRSIAALQRLAKLFLGQSKLLKNRDGFLVPKLVKRLQQMTEEGWRKDRLKAALSKAVTFWRDGRYEDFAGSLSEWEMDLSPAMAAKLQYARRNGKLT